MVFSLAGEVNEGDETMADVPSQNLQELQSGIAWTSTGLD